jgi:hypothetical protein
MAYIPLHETQEGVAGLEVFTGEVFEAVETGSVEVDKWLEVEAQAFARGSQLHKKEDNTRKCLDRVTDGEWRRGELSPMFGGWHDPRWRLEHRVLSCKNRTQVTVRTCRCPGSKESEDGRVERRLTDSERRWQESSVVAKIREEKGALAARFMPSYSRGRIRSSWDHAQVDQVAPFS